MICEFLWTVMVLFLEIVEQNPAHDFLDVGQLKKRQQTNLLLTTNLFSY